MVGYKISFDAVTQTAVIVNNQTYPKWRKWIELKFDLNFNLTKVEEWDIHFEPKEIGLEGFKKYCPDLTLELLTDKLRKGEYETC